MSKREANKPHYSYEINYQCLVKGKWIKMSMVINDAILNETYNRMLHDPKIRNISYQMLMEPED